MKCLVCKTGELAEGKTTVNLTRGESTIVIKEVPANVCDSCGEYILDSLTADKV